MDNNTSFNITQDLEIIPPEKDKAYIIPKRDWDFLKGKVSRISSSVNVYHTAGSIIIGLSGTAWLNIFFMDFPKNATGSYGNKYVVCLSFAICTAVVGILLLFFGKQKKNDQRIAVEDVTEEMVRTEERYSSAPE